MSVPHAFGAMILVLVLAWALHEFGVYLASLEDHRSHDEQRSRRRIRREIGQIDNRCHQARNGVHNRDGTPVVCSIIHDADDSHAMWSDR